MDVYRGVRRKQKKFRGRLVFLALVPIVIGAVAWFGMGYWQNRTGPPPSDEAEGDTSSSQADEEPVKPTLVNLQPVVDEWVAGQSGEFGIMVYDPANKVVIASHNTGTQFFTASIYKLYVVYLALEDIEAGKHSLDEDFKFGKTRQQCLHDAIHSSDSPCAEALLNEIGQEEVTARLKAMELAGTSFPAFLTNAQDAMFVLQRLHARFDLNENSAKLILDAMKTQIYRDGLAKGMPEAAVATKVGFSETPHYHETGVITLPNGREYLVSFFSKGASSRAVADFGTTIYQALR
jgi:beta-lactamase class A